MGLVRITNPNELRAGHIVLLALIALALAGTCLLTSAGKPAVLPDGAVAWDPDSILLALVEILDLQYAQPTPNGVAIKGLVFGAVSGVALLVAALGLAAWARSERDTGAGDAVIDVETAASDAAPTLAAAHRQLNPIRTAQVLMLLYVLWSLASVLWADAPDYALGGAALLAGQVLWAFALGFGLNRRAAVYAGYLLVGGLAACAALAIAYHAQRNPTLRASYPIGNPLFLASCLLPGLVIAAVVAVGGARDAVGGRPARGVVRLVVAVLVLALVGYATWLTRSRGPAIGLALALAALVFFSGGRRLRIALASATVVGMVVLGTFLFSQRFAESTSGRSVSMRLRLFSWPYALELFTQRPFIGGGQGHYTLVADALASGDVVNDPAPLEQRIAHAHCEWLEVATDLGSVGLLLLMASLGLTLLGGARALPGMRVRAHRMMTIALLASLVGLMVAECFGVALRFEGLPLIFFTVLGLIWVLASPTPATLLFVLGRYRAVRWAMVLTAGAVGCLVAESARRDFSAARAAYDVVRVFESGELEKADTLAERAFRDRMIPHRKLMAHRLMVDVKLRIAIRLQEQYRRRALLAESSGVTDPRLRSEAASSRRACELKIAEGERALMDLAATAPSIFHAGSMAYGFRQLRAVFAEIDNDSAAALEYQRAAAHALRGEIVRRPFDAELAARYVLSAFDHVDLNEACVLLARPLRLHRPGPGYLTALNRMLAATGGQDVFMATFDELAALPVADLPGQWPQRWTPELLRLGAIAAYVQPNYDRAARYLERATTYYDKLGADAPLAKAACHAELADALFFQQPLTPEPAITAAERSLELAPHSQDGRRLSGQLAQRLVTYHLAAGHEEFARKIIREWTLARVAADVDALLAERYVELAYSVFNAVWRAEPQRMIEWSRRALELTPESAPPWFLAGDIAVHQRDEQRVVECARATLRFGGDPADVIGLLERALQTIPDSLLLRRMLQALERATLPGGQNAPSAPPAAAVTSPTAIPHDVGTSAVAISTNGL